MTHQQLRSLTGKHLLYNSYLFVITTCPVYGELVTNWWQIGLFFMQTWKNSAWVYRCTHFLHIFYCPEISSATEAIFNEPLMDSVWSKNQILICRRTHLCHSKSFKRKLHWDIFQIRVTLFTSAELSPSHARFIYYII